MVVQSLRAADVALSLPVEVQPYMVVQSLRAADVALSFSVEVQPYMVVQSLRAVGSSAPSGGAACGHPSRPLAWLPASLGLPHPSLRDRQRPTC